MSWLAIGLIALAAFAVSCGGDDDEASAGAPAAGAAATAAPTTAASVDFGTPVDLKSFRYSMAIEISGDAISSGGSAAGIQLDLDFGIELEGAVISPDRERSELTANLGFAKITMETVRIGDRSWVRPSGGDWEEEPSDGLGEFGLDFGLSPADFLGGDISAAGLEPLLELARGLDGKNETVNGVEAVRYELTAEQFAAAFPEGQDLADLAPEDAVESLGDFKTTIWIARDLGVPVRLVLEGSAEGDDGEGTITVELNITDINSSDIEIEPPI